MSDEVPSRVIDTTGTPPDNDFPFKALELATSEEAENQGWWAYIMGAAADLNPYPRDDFAREWWDGGWNSACGEDCG